MSMQGAAVNPVTTGIPVPGQGFVTAGPPTYVASPSSYATAIPAFGPAGDSRDGANGQGPHKAIQYKKKSYYRRAYVPYITKTSDGELVTVIDKETPMDYYQRVGPLGLIYGAVSRIVD